MPWEVRQILLMVHILLAIIWVGGVLFVGWGVFPAARTLTYKVQREFFHALMKWTHWLFTLAGTGVIATGTLLGTVGGPIKTWNDIWQTTYGHIWATAFIVATFTLLWGITFGYKQSMKVFSEEERWIWKMAANGDKHPLNQSMLKIVVIEGVEAIGFIILIALMVML